MIYTVISKGFEGHPEFGNKTEALEYLRDTVSQEKKRCSMRFNSATKHKLGDSHYRVTIGKDKGSALWGEYSMKKET